MPDDLDERVTDDSRITLARDRELAHALVQLYPADLYPEEQDCWIETAKYRIERARRSTDPETLFAMLADLLDDHDAVPVTMVDGDAVYVSGEDELPALCLDDEGRIEVDQLDRDELLEKVEAGISSLNDDELIEMIETHADREGLESFAAALAACD